MRECVLVLKMADTLSEMEGADYAGADRGALFLAEQKKRIAFSIGDFDSVSEEERRLIEAYSDEMIRLHPIKDNSDSEAAVDEAVRRGYDRIILAGATGGRLDHEIVNIRLCFKYPQKVVLLDSRNRCMAYACGSHRIEKQGYRYVSLFAMKECEISLSGFKYPLCHRIIDDASLYGLSNELLGEEGILEVHRGTVLCVESTD